MIFCSPDFFEEENDGWLSWNNNPETKGCASKRRVWAQDGQINLIMVEGIGEVSRNEYNQKWKAKILKPISSVSLFVSQGKMEYADKLSHVYLGNNHFGYWYLIRSGDDTENSKVFNQVLSTFKFIGKVETANWISFDSVKDTGIKPDFTFKHPSNWIQRGSIDGGASSYIPFYEKDKYSQRCDETVNGATTCHVTGQIASVLVSGPSMAPAKIEYDSETREATTVDRYQGTKISGTVKSGVEFNAYIGKPGQKEMRVIIPNVNGIHFEFTMLIGSKTDKMTFGEILKTIDLKF